MSKEIAKILVDIKSINFSFDKYFTLTSGLASPVYVDCRKIISFTKERNFIIDKAVDYLTKNNIDSEIIAGGGISEKKDIEHYIELGADHISLGTVCFNPVKLGRLL